MQQFNFGEGILFLLKKEFPFVTQVGIEYDSANDLYMLSALIIKKHPIYEMLDNHFYVVVKGGRELILQDLETKLRLLKP